jgi:hypothetical protein
VIVEAFSSEQVVLAGESGFFKGEEYILRPGTTYCIGRSSGCEISMKNTDAFKNLEKDGILVPPRFRMTSARHWTVTVSDSGGTAETSTQLKVRTGGSLKVTIRCVSANGITVDGKKVSDMMIPDLSKSVYTIEFGGAEVMKLFLRRLH